MKTKPITLNYKDRAPEKLNQYATDRVLKACIDADLHYHLNGTPHAEYMQKEAQKHLGQARRIMLQVAALGDRAALWMDKFISQITEMQNDHDKSIDSGEAEAQTCSGRETPAR